jgi:hypothetical protein
MQSNRDVRKTGRWGMWPLAAAAIGAFILVGTAPAPAQAGSGFEHGFEDQLGRIFAFEAVNLGKHMLFQGVSHPYRGTNHRSYDRGDDHRYVRYESRHGYGKHYWKSRRRDHKRHDRWQRKHGRDDYRNRHDGDRGREHRHDRSCRSSHAY